jgi:hypothetical protein
MRQRSMQLAGGRRRVGELAPQLGEAQKIVPVAQPLPLLRHPLALGGVAQALLRADGFEKAAHGGA